MKNLLSILFLLCLISNCFADGVTNPPLEITEEDSAPSTFPYKLKVTNGTLTDNGDETVSINTSGSGSVSDTAYAASWDGVTTIAPSKNAVYDKFESSVGSWTRTAPYIYPTTITDNVGIGFTAPLGWLQVGTSPSAPILFITKEGNVGLGTTAPISALDINGAINFRSITTPSTPPANSLKLYSVVTQGHTRPTTMDDDGIEFTINRDNVFLVRNTSGSGMTKGQAVYISGSTGNIPNVALAKADSLNTLPAVGILAADLANNAYGNLINIGHLVDFDTSSFSAGDRLYVSAATAGVLTATRPSYPNYAQRMGSVMVSGVGNGSIHVTTAPFIGGEESGTTANPYVFGGNVGVGNTAPVYTLDVSGDLRATGDIISADQYTITGNIGASGNLGAGTTAPIYRLDVQGSGNAILNMTGNVGVGTTLPVGLLQVGTSPNAPLVVLKSGNVGVGTTNPTFRLQVNNADLSVGTGDIYVGSYVFHSADTDTAINFTDDQIDFIAGNVTLLSLDEATQDVIKFGGAAIDVDVNINSQVFVEGSSGNVGVGTTAPATLLDVNGVITATSGNSTNWNTAYTHSQDNTQAHSDYLLNNADDSTSGILTAAGYYSTGNVGVGNTLPQALLDVGTSPGVGLIVKNTGNVGIGTTAPARKLDIIGTMRTSETYPVFRLDILDVGGSVGVGTTIPGSHLHKDKNWVIDRLRSWLTGGTSVNFTVKGSVFPGTGPFYNLFVGQTSIPGGLTVAGSASTTVPADHLVVIDIIATAGTAPGMGIIMDGHEQ